MSAPRRNWRDRFFPARHLPNPAESHGFAAGWITVHSETHLSWPDRLRVLVSGCLETKSYILTNVKVERAQTSTVVYVMPPGSLKPRRGFEQPGISSGRK